MIKDGKRVLPLAPFDSEKEAIEWMRKQPPIQGMTRGVHYEDVIRL
jgi:hypothetical protein